MDDNTSASTELDDSRSLSSCGVWDGMDAKEQRSLSPLPSSIDSGGPRNNSPNCLKLPDHPSDDGCSPSRHKKGKEKEQRIDEDATPNEAYHLTALPSELVDSILALLAPRDLNSVAATCRFLYAHAMADHIWQALVQANVPGVRLESPSPCPSYRDLYRVHDPRWFLTKYKIWFSDRDLTGRLIVVRYDPRRGCIEGYQLVAISSRSTWQTWEANSNVIIHSFEPSVKLHLDKPILQLDAHTPDDPTHVEPGLTLIQIPLHQEESGAEGSATAPVQTMADGSDESSSGSSNESQSAPPENHFEAETPMNLGSPLMCSNFMLARPLDQSVAAERASLPFPYGNVWPPPVIPAQHRVVAARMQLLDIVPLLPSDTPNCRREVSDQAFRIHTWLGMRGSSIRRTQDGLAHGPGHTAGILGNGPGGVGIFGWSQLLQTPGALGGLLDMNMPPPVGLHIGEDLSTYATLDPILYTPTAAKPYRGIWVGDYSGHGCEFLLINQPDDNDDFDPAKSIVQRTDETPEEFARRKHDETVYRGRLEAIKLTGDPNVPRGEYTFVVEDLGEKGFVTVVQDPPFKGARVVKSKGHVAHTGFLNDKFIESQLILVSPRRLAQYWVGFGHISYFERVDIDRFLVPD